MQRLGDIAPGKQPTDDERAAAQRLVGCLERTILPHHREEEREFWPLVARAEATPEERIAFVRLAQQLQEEHVELERRWALQTDHLRQLAAGRLVSLDGAALQELAQRYRQHTQLEDDILVPLARHLLSPSEKTRMAVSVLLSRLPVGKWGMV